MGLALGWLRHSSQRGVRAESGEVGDVHAADWGSCKDGLQVRAQRSHIGRASGSVGSKKEVTARHAGERV